MPCRQARPPGRRLRARTPHKSGHEPVPASASVRRDCPRHQRGRGFWSSVRRGIDRSLARRLFLRPGAMLVRPDNGGIDHHVFVVVIACQQLENALENPALGPPVEALVDDFPASETLRKIAPWNARSISERTASTNSRLSAAVPPTWPSRPGRKSLIRSH